MNNSSADAFPCRFCGQPVTQVFVDLGMSPLANAYPGPAKLRDMEPYYPLRVSVCSACLLVQLPSQQTPESLFSDYAYFSSYSESWLKHAADFAAAAVERWQLGAHSQVIEVASNDGYLLRAFRQRNIPVLGIEPATNIARVAVEQGIPTLNRFFGEQCAAELAEQGMQADLLVGNNVLAHVPDLNDFVAGLRTLLKPTGVISLEFPHLLRLMAENQFDTIYHEHFSYFSLLVVEKVFAKHQLALFDVQELPTHGGSLRISVRHAANTSLPVQPSVAALKQRECAAGLDHLPGYTAYPEQVRETKRALLELLIGIRRRGHSIAAYGAAAKGNTLLNYCGIGSDFLDFVADRSPAKQGRYLPGTHLPIRSPEAIADAKPDYVLILPWNLADEIRQQLAFIREWGGQFIVPVPVARILP